MMPISTYTVRVDENKAGLRLDRLLAESLPELSRSRAKALITEGLVRAADGGPMTEPSRPVRAGDVFEVGVPPPPDGGVEAQSMPLNVAFEDDDIIVLDKPPGLVVHPGAGNPDRTLVNALLAHCGGRLADSGAPRRPGIVHRLDKDTSGLIVVAKTDAAYAGLVPQFAAHSIERVYSALVWGRPIPGRGRIEVAIGRDRRERKRMTVVRRGGKPAATQYSAVEDVGSLACLLECRPETGRTHQIRVHLWSLGHPIVGDPVYGGGGRLVRHLPESARAAASAFGRQALHAHLMGLRHPTTGERLRFHAALPNDFKALTDFLKRI